MSDKSEVFNETYFMNGISAGVSNYFRYEYKPDLTVPMAKAFLDFLDVGFGQSVLDYGCARGYFVRALRELGKAAWGKDLSKWAIENCDPEIKAWVSNDLEIKPLSFDWIMSKDCLEHVDGQKLCRVVTSLINGARRGVLIIVPLSSEDGGAYLREEDRLDVTHKIRWPLQVWLKFFSSLAPDFTVHGSYHIPGLKPASLKVPHSCGFFTLKRIQ